LKFRVKEEQLLRIPRRAGQPQRRFCYINYTQTHTYTRARARTHARTRTHIERDATWTPSTEFNKYHFWNCKGWLIRPH